MEHRHHQRGIRVSHRHAKANALQHSDSFRDILLLTIEKMQTETEYLTGDGGHAAARNSGVYNDHIQRNEESKPWVSVSIQPSENRKTVAVHARNKQTKTISKLQPRTIHTELPPPARRSPPLQRRPSRRPRTLPTSRLVPSPWRIPPRVSENRLLNLFKAVGRDVNHRAILLDL